MEKTTRFPMKVFVGREIEVDSLEALQHLAKSLEGKEGHLEFKTAEDGESARAAKDCRMVTEFNAFETDYRNEYTNVGTIVRTCMYQRTVRTESWECTDGSSFECVKSIGPWQKTGVCLP